MKTFYLLVPVIRTLCLILVCTLIANQAYSQSTIKKAKDSSMRWMTSSETFPGSIKAFEGNKGQYENISTNDKVLFGCLYGGATMLFTEKGFSYFWYENIRKES